MTIDRDKPSADTGVHSARRWTYVIAAAASVLVLCAFRVSASPVARATVLLASQASRSVWDGVYTEEQAKRGGEVYAQECAFCHGEKLEGDAAPPLVGDGFTSGLNGRTMGDFFARLSATMPEDGPGRLSPQQYADVIAQLLRANEYPAGSTELSPDPDALKQIGFKEKPAGN